MSSTCGFPPAQKVLGRSFGVRSKGSSYQKKAGFRMTGVEDPQGRVTNYERCACGELLSMTDPKGQRTSWKNDIEGRLLTKTFPDASTYHYAYELTTSRLLTFTDAKSQVSTYTYNLDDSINQIAYTASAVATPTVSYSYDPYYLRLTQIQVGTAQTNYTYYPAGGLGGGSIWTDTSPIPNSGITYSYDQLGRVTTTSINGSTSTLTFDPLDRPSHETDSALSSTPFIYGYVGNTPRLQSVSYPNGQSASYSYQPGPNQDFRLTDLTNFKTGTTVLSKFDYTYNANGTIASWQQQVESNNPTTWKYQYDGADQLLSAIETNSSQVQLAQYVYSYDLAGNRKSQQIGLAVKSTTINNPMNKIDSVGGGGPLQFTGNLSEPAQVTVGGSPALVNPTNNTFSGTANVTAGITNNVSVVANDYNGNFSTNNYHVFVPSSTAVTMGYDANGNLNTNGQGQTYEWDAKDQLTAINYTGGAVVNGITRTEFTYDGLSRRVAIVEKQGSAVYTTKQFVWVGDRMAEERDGSGNVTKRFFGLGEQIGTTVYYLTRDHLGSIREVTNSSGVVQAQARYDYDPYGAAPLGSTSNLISGTNLSDFQYAGMYQHATSLLNLTKYRAYDPNTGRWLGRDPLGESKGSNLYAYCADNPVNFIDPYGTDVWIYNAGGGHAYIVVTNPNTKYGYTIGSYYPANYGSGGSSGSASAVDTKGKNDDSSTPLPPGGTQIHTTPAQDAAILAKIQDEAKNPGNYKVWGNNCANVARQEVQAGIPEFPGTWLYDSPDSLADAAKQFATPGGSGSSTSSSSSSSSSSPGPNPGPD
jgi:RHS repeat-associated protein